MRPRPRFRSLGRLVFVFLLIVCLVCGGLGWLAWRVLDQDRRQERQGILDRLGTGADLVSASLTRRLAEVEALLAETGDGMTDAEWRAHALAATKAAPEAAVFVVFGRERAEAVPAGALRYYPIATSFDDAAAERFARGEAAEYRQHDPAAAAVSFREAARSSDAAIQAGALLRLARAERKRSQYMQALAIYGRLATLRGVRFGDLPADLVARHARCSLLEVAPEGGDLQAEAAALASDLRTGQWQLTESAYLFYLAEARRWSGPAWRDDPSEEAALAMAAGAAAVWNDWPAIKRGESAAAGRRSAWIHNRPLLVVWRGGANALVAFIANPDFIERSWMGGLRDATGRLNLRVGLADAESHPVLAPENAHAGYRVVRSSAETGLPWTLQVSSADASADLAQLTVRRRFIIAAFGLIIALVVLASSATARAVSRELAVARLQSDFVSAVSHEFRTPLASLRQISEMLADGRVPTDERRSRYYDDLRHESRRLQRLVENLLDFARMESGARRYRFDRVETADLLGHVVAEFGREAAAQGYRIDVAVDPGIAPIAADRDAIALVVWNLLDNAVKYSPDTKTVWVHARNDAGLVAIGVRDRGLGLAPDEQRRVFEKFVRGSSAKVAGVGGTGLGLAMARQIAEAHGGRIQVVSRPGEGSEFTIELPAYKE